MSDPVGATLSALAASTESLLRTASMISDEQVYDASLLPGWTRGHVLTHIARNADAMVNLATWARTGTETPMYPSPEQRDADIEAGAGRPAQEQVDDLAASAERLSAALEALDERQWQARIVIGRSVSTGREMTGTFIPVLRRVEVEVHHVDLGLDYTLAHLPEDLIEQMIADRARELTARDEVPGFVVTANDDEGRWTVKGGGPEITGTPPSLLGWLLGRTDGIGLHSEQALPVLGAWR